MGTVAMARTMVRRTPLVRSSLSTCRQNDLSSTHQRADRSRLGSYTVFGQGTWVEAWTVGTARSKSRTTTMRGRPSGTFPLTM